MAKKANEPARKDAQLSNEAMKSGIVKIGRRIGELDAFDISTVNDRSDPRIEALDTKLLDLLVTVFGSESTQYHSNINITRLDKAGWNMMSDTSIQEVREGLERGVGQAKAVLQAIKEGFEEEIEDAGESQTARPLRAYEGLDLHPHIDRHIGKLYLDGHYAEAVEKSVKVLNDIVRMQSGVELDGTSLMEKVFNPTNPILRFNDLADQSDKDEQKGFMFMFCGAVSGLRNPRAHRLMSDDPERALEFIAFVSLLAKLVEESKNV